jgi:ribonucleoside-diphosphate reductase alpha chain
MALVKHQLTHDEYLKFPMIQPPDQLPTNPLNLTAFSGLQRITMLDRYSLRDNSLKTLKSGDIVVTTVKEHPKYPTQGYGIVKAIDDLYITVDIQYPDSVLDDKGDLIDLKNFKAKRKYTFKPLEIYWEQIAYRNAKAIAAVEKKDKDKWFEEFYWLLANKYFIPGGRILYGAGSGSEVTLFNCFVLPFIGDARSKIIKHIGTATEIMARGGGVGSNISCLRPAKTKVAGVNGYSSGSVSWADYLSKLTHLIEQGGSRYVKIA